MGSTSRSTTLTMLRSPSQSKVPSDGGSVGRRAAFAFHWGMRGDNPVKGVERYVEERRERWLSDIELKRLLAVLATHPNRRAANAARPQL